MKNPRELLKQVLLFPRTYRGYQISILDNAVVSSPIISGTRIDQISFGAIVDGPNQIFSNSNSDFLLSIGGTGALGTSLIYNSIDPDDILYFSSNLIFNANVTAVPVPAAFWLFSSSLIGLYTVKRNKPDVS